MISEASCDTEDWKIQLCITEINYILKDIKTVVFNCYYCIFDQLHADLVNIRDFFQKYKILLTPNSER